MNLSLAADKVERAIDTNLDYQLYSQALMSRSMTRAASSSCSTLLADSWML